MAAIDDHVVPEVVDLVTVDVSYLPVADAVRSLRWLRLAPQAGLVALIKPTFELRASSLVTDARAVRHAIHIAVEAIDRVSPMLWSSASWPRGSRRCTERQHLPR